MWKIDDAELGGAVTSGTLDQEGCSADSDLPLYPIIYVVIVSNSSISLQTSASFQTLRFKSLSILLTVEI